jgi:hypothetical protein
MFDINLLPTNLVPDKKLLNTVRNLTLVNIVASIILIAFSVLVLGLIMLNTSTLSQMEKSKNTLTDSIKSMQAVEQQYSLVKDRVGNIVKIVSQPDAQVVLKLFKEGYLDQGLTVSGKLGFVAGKTELAITLPDLASLTAVLSNLKVNIAYKNMTVDKISFDPVKGYELIVRTE